MTENVRLTKAAGVVGVSTLLSRILGFIRDVLIARFFGAGFTSDAFFVAFRIPNLLRRLFAEGSLSMAFVSVFTEQLVRNGKQEAIRFASSALKLLSVILVLVSLIGILLSPVIIRLLAPGFLDHPEKLSLTIMLTQIMFPYIFFIGLVALCMGILNALDHFVAPALAPVLLNIAMIGGMLWISPHMKDPIVGLAAGVIIGGVLQLALQVPFLIKKGIYLLNRVRVYHAGIKKVGTLMLPMVFGAAVYQINILVGTFLASFLREGSVSYLYYADRLVQFPLGIFAVAISTAVLPVLSRQAVEKDFVAVKETFCYALKLVFYVTVPAMVGLIVLREPIVTLLFQRGEFDVGASRLTACALLYYGIGIWAFSAIRVVISTYYAIQDTKTPVKAAVVSVFANIILGSMLMIPLGHSGIALAASISSMLNFYLLSRMLKARLGEIEWKNMAPSVAKTVVGALMMGAVVQIVSQYTIPTETGSSYFLFLGLLISMMTGLIFYGMYSFLIKHPEFKTIYNIALKGMPES